MEPTTDELPTLRPSGFAELTDARLLLVDDDDLNLRMLERLLRAAGFHDLVAVQDPRAAEAMCMERAFDVVLLDLHMTPFDGFTLMTRILAQPASIAPAILVLTGDLDRSVRVRALDAGARDVLTKPFDPAELLARVRNLIEVTRRHYELATTNHALDSVVRIRTAELRVAQLEIVQRLARATELRDNETGFHVVRMSRCAARIAEHLGWSRDEVELVLHASPMHDIGKLGIPDSILLKPGPLTPDELAIMRTHTTIGAQLLEGASSDLVHMAREIALTHHEKWDGTGYPHGWSGERIPAVGRIVAIADVFDALTSTRPYKRPWSLDETLEHLRAQRGKHFDPDVVDAFFTVLPEVLRDRRSFPDV